MLTLDEKRKYCEFSLMATVEEFEKEENYELKTESEKILSEVQTTSDETVIDSLFEMYIRSSIEALDLLNSKGRTSNVLDVAKEELDACLENKED